MKIVLNTILVALSTLIYSKVSAQTDIENHYKYWYFKTRFNNDFIKIGLGDGESIPFNQRGAQAPNKYATNAELKAGDASATLGYYIGVLATEYKLLQANNQSTETVKHELFCALNAINRLDYKAEGLWQFGAENLNGFFIRDDVPSSLLFNNYSHFNYYDNGSATNNNQLSRGFCSRMESGANKITSDWIERVEKNSPNVTIAMSQDQVYNILFGLSLVNKFVPSYETDNNAVFGYGSGISSLTQEARNIARRIIKHIKDSKDLNGNSCNTGTQTGWRIKNPTSCVNVSTGDDATFFAYPIAETGCIVDAGLSSGNQLGGIGLSLAGSPKVCGNGSPSNFHNYYSSVPGFAAWKATGTSVLPNIDNRVFAVNLMAMCNCMYGSVGDQVIQSVVQSLQQSAIFGWLGIVIGWIWNVISSILTTVIPGYYFNTTSLAINNNAYYELAGFKPAPIDHAPLARKILHGGIYTPNTDYTFKYLLDVAPCDNIYNFGINDQSTYQWSSNQRLDHPNRRGITPVVTGEYNGIDFMLYHNLWYIHQLQQGNNPAIEDYSNIYINKNGGTAPLASIYKAFETIQTKNTIFHPQNNLGYMRAGKTIYFGPGTEIRTGATNGGLLAYIKNVACATDNGDFYAARTSSADSTLTSYEDLQPHYVNYSEENALEPSDSKNLVEELPLTVEQQVENALTQAYPNYSRELFVKPTISSGAVNLYFSLSENEFASVKVLNLNGAVIFSKDNIDASNSSLSIDLTTFPNGVYLVNYNTTNGVSRSDKIVKQ